MLLEVRIQVDVSVVNHVVEVEVSDVGEKVLDVMSSVVTSKRFQKT
jgi:hypothetical protein